MACHQDGGAAGYKVPPMLKQFMADNGIDDCCFRGHTTRHIRVNPRRPLALALIAAQLGHTPARVPWLPDVFALPSSVKLATSPAYKGGHIYGIDVASAAAVAALAPQPGDCVLDLCCAPGAKLSLLADLVTPPTEPASVADGSATQGGFVVGVDVSEPRLASTRTVLRKYGQCNVRLYLGDATVLQLLCPRPATEEQARLERVALAKEWSSVAGRKGSGGDGGRRGSKKKKKLTPAPAAAAHCGGGGAGDARGTDGGGEGQDKDDSEAGERAGECAGSEAGASPSRASPGAATAAPRQGRAATRFFFETSLQVGSWVWSEQSGARAQFDKVLVDAECTHDASVRHVAKFADQWGWDTFDERFNRDGRLDALQSLQRQLLRNGFAHLKPGGELVYSTCSAAPSQNEAVVQWLLDTEPAAQLLPLPPCAPGAAAMPCKHGLGGMPHVVRFDPATSGSSGMFVARLRKRSDADTSPASPSSLRQEDV